MNTGGGNRQDNRQRGNAAQLLEKYKGMARDAQMQGDRVQTEYYLQFADHYYRVLNENRARFEEQRRQRGDAGYEAGYDDDDQDDGDNVRDPGDQGYDEPEAREVESPRQAEPSRESRREGNGEYRTRRPRGRRPDEGESDEDRGDERIAADLLPPSISTASEPEEEERAPRRRTRRPRSPGEEVAPAA